jgi:hypothetical protein
MWLFVAFVLLIGFDSIATSQTLILSDLARFSFYISVNILDETGKDIHRKNVANLFSQERPCCTGLDFLRLYLLMLLSLFACL